MVQNQGSRVEAKPEQQRNLRNDSFVRPVDGQLGERFGTQSLDAFRKYLEQNR
jgi:hypothetical protein